MLTPISEGVFKIQGVLFTKNKVSGVSVYGERLDGEFREFDPTHSKFAAALVQGMVCDLSTKDNVLYLGSSTGTTVSHISDITNGIVFALDVAPRVMRDLLFMAEKRNNIAPILADASVPDNYKSRIPAVDWLFQDIAQRDQVGIFLKNLVFLKKGKQCVLVIKARSMDVSKSPKLVFDEVKALLAKAVKVEQVIDISKYHTDHCVFVCKKLG